MALYQPWHLKLTLELNVSFLGLIDVQLTHAL